MKEIKLLKLRLVNFKGVKEFELNADGENVKVYGDNATGKTTLFDGFTWLLFDKDSQNKSPRHFGIKTLKDGQVIHNLNHEVEAELMIDNNRRTLKKVYKEIWKTETGQIEKKQDGHTTDYFIDGTPSKKKDYVDLVASLINENVFRLITNPSYFNEVLEWRDRREILLEIAGEVSEDEVLASDEAFKPLVAAMDGRDIESHKKKVQSDRTEVKKRLKVLPELISENHLNLPNLDGLDETTIKSQLDKLSLEIESKNNDINAIKNGSEVSEIKSKISDLNLQINNVKNDHLQNEQQEVYKLEARLQEEKSNLNIMRNDVKNKINEKERKEALLLSEKERLDKVKRDGQALSKEEFTGEHTCPTCSQNLPEDQMEAANANFNKNKSEKLEALRATGKDLISNITEMKGEIESLEKTIEKATKDGKEKDNDVKKIEEKLEVAKTTVSPIEENEKYIKLNKEIAELNAEIANLEESTDASVEKVREGITALNSKRSELQSDLSKIEQSEKIKDRITHLESEQKELAGKDEQLALQLHLIDKFTNKKVSLLEESINDRFKFAEFNLFNKLVSGALDDTCETTYKGVPYGAGLNNAARINVGLDIINTLSEHYKAKAPIFVDNAESITELIDVKSQLISLVVSADDKELRIEGESSSESEVA